MTIHLFQDKGTALERQRLSWKDMVGKPISKLDDDAFTRVRAIPHERPSSSMRCAPSRSCCA